MTFIMSDASVMNALYEHNWQLIGHSGIVIDDSRVILQFVASFKVVIYNRHIFIAQATVFFHCTTFF